MNAQNFAGYFFVSTICMLLNNVILIVADMSGCPLWLAVLLSYCIVVVAGYLLHSLISFRTPFGMAAFGRYAVAMAANIPLMFGMIWAWRDAAGLPMAFAAPIATGCMFCINFVLCRWAVFHRDETSRATSHLLNRFGFSHRPRLRDAT